jgi:hypothetical protein
MIARPVNKRKSPPADSAPEGSILRHDHTELRYRASPANVSPSAERSPLAKPLRPPRHWRSVRAIAAVLHDDSLLPTKVRVLALQAVHGHRFGLWIDYEESRELLRANVQRPRRRAVLAPLHGVGWRR